MAIAHATLKKYAWASIDKLVWPLVAPPGDSGPIDRLFDTAVLCPRIVAGMEPTDPTATTLGQVG